VYWDVWSLVVLSCWSDGIQLWQAVNTEFNDQSAGTCRLAPSSSRLTPPPSPSSLSLDPPTGETCSPLRTPDPLGQRSVHRVAVMPAVPTTRQGLALQCWDRTWTAYFPQPRIRRPRRGRFALLAAQASIDLVSIKRQGMWGFWIGEAGNRLPANLPARVFEAVDRPAALSTAWVLPILNRPGRIEVREECLLLRVAGEGQRLGPRPSEDASADSQVPD